MVRDHTDLDVWKLCDELSDRVHEITARPTFTDETLQGQLNEAADSPCPNVGEGFSRYYPRDNSRFVRVAKGSVTEVIEHMAKVRKRGYATAEECDDIFVLARRARGAITGYLLYLESARSPNPPSDSQRRRPIDRELVALSLTRPIAPTLGEKYRRSRNLETPEPSLASTGRRNDSRQLISGRFEAKGFPRALIQSARNAVEVRLRVLSKVGAATEILAEQAMGIFVGAPLPRAVRVAEVHGDVGRDGEALMGRQFAATIPGERPTELLR
jgi:four helix bundle protein